MSHVDQVLELPRHLISDYNGTYIQYDEIGELRVVIPCEPELVSSGQVSLHFHDVVAFRLTTDEFVLEDHESLDVKSGFVYRSISSQWADELRVAETPTSKAVSIPLEHFFMTLQHLGLIEVACSSVTLSK